MPRRRMSHARLRVAHFGRRIRHHKGKFPIVGAAVFTLPLFRAFSRVGGIGGVISGLLNDPATVVDAVVNEYTGAQSDGGFNPTKLTATAVPIAVYLILKKVAGRRINSVMRHIGL